MTLRKTTKVRTALERIAPFVAECGRTVEPIFNTPYWSDDWPDFQKKFNVPSHRIKGDISLLIELGLFLAEAHDYDDDMLGVLREAVRWDGHLPDQWLRSDTYQGLAWLKLSDGEHRTWWEKDQARRRNMAARRVGFEKEYAEVRNELKKVSP